jgi:hypothetical protein
MSFVTKIPSYSVRQTAHRNFSQQRSAHVVFGNIKIRVYFVLRPNMFCKVQLVYIYEV